MAKKSKIGQPIKDVLAGDTAPAITLGPDVDILKAYALQHRFDITQLPAEDDAILHYMGHEIGGRSNIITITGLSKSRKSVIASAIASAMFSKTKTFLGFESSLRDDEKVLHIDTEQAYKHYYNSVARVSRDVGVTMPDNFISYHTRDAEPKFRVELVEYLLELERPSVLILDGITDFIYDINSQEEATTIGQRLITWGTKYNCLIICVIHTTKSTGFMTGAIGTYLEKKCQTAIKVEKPDDNQDISNITCQYSRDKPFPAFTIQFNEELGRYEVVDEHKIDTKGKAGAKAPDLYADDIHKQIINRIFLVSSFMPERDIPGKIKHFAKEVTKDEISKTMAGQWMKFYGDRAWIFADPDGNYRRTNSPAPMRVAQEDGPPPDIEFNFEQRSDDLPF